MAAREIVHTDQAPAAIGPYNQAVKRGHETRTAVREKRLFRQERRVRERTGRREEQEKIRISKQEVTEESRREP